MEHARHNSARQSMRRILLSFFVLALFSRETFAQTRVIEIVASKDSRYVVGGQDKPEIAVKAGEALVLRITAYKGKSWNRDGSIYGFTLLRSKNRTKVQGWDLLLKPGTQEFRVNRSP